MKPSRTPPKSAVGRLAVLFAFAILSFGYYFNAALGQNSLMLRVFGNVSYLVVGNLVAAIINLGLDLLLIPARMGQRCPLVDRAHLENAPGDSELASRPSGP